MAALVKMSSETQAQPDATMAARKTKKMVAGACSGMISALAFQPLDVLRTHQQGAFGSLPKSQVTAVRPYLAHEPSALPPLLTRVRAMWRGTSSTLIRVAGGAGLYFVTLDHCLVHFSNTATNTFLAGAFARTFAGCVMSPFTIVKARMEWQAPGTYRTNVDVFRQVLRDDGFRGLYRGIVPTLFRDVPFSGLYVLLYTRIKKALEAKEAEYPAYLVHFSSGVGAGIVATSIVHPADVVKTRMQLTLVREGPAGEVLHVRNDMSLRDTVRKIAREEGWRGFSKGILPRVLKRTLSTAVTWTIYEHLSLK